MQPLFPAVTAAVRQVLVRQRLPKGQKSKFGVAENHQSRYWTALNIEKLGRLFIFIIWVPSMINTEKRKHRGQLCQIASPANYRRK